jgi:hypothetical protein
MSLIEATKLGENLTLFNSIKNLLFFYEDKINGTCIECCLTFQFTDLYQNIDRKSLFNLKPELRGPFTNGEFLPDYPIQITATLQPDLLIHLQNYPTSEAATTYLQTLSQIQPDHPLLAPENWYALEVTQTQDTNTTGYRTLWHYINPAHLASENPSSEYVTAQLTDFFKASFNFDVLPLDDLAITPQLDHITEALTSSLESLWTTSETDLDDALTAITSAFTDIADGLSELVDEIPTDDDEAPQLSLFSILTDFFTQNDWTFTKLSGDLALHTTFQGENATWACYAKVREAPQQFVFYSICPIAIPKTKRNKIAQFLTLANYGTLIGNFELDYNDGEIRYKTSIDVEGDRLTPALIHRLVYTNITMMDEYIPGIQSVLAGQDPGKVISSIEQPSDSSSSIG